MPVEVTLTCFQGDLQLYAQPIQEAGKHKWITLPTINDVDGNAYNITARKSDLDV